MKYSHPYQPPIVTVDAVIFQIIDNALHVLAVKRTEEPFKGSWALPGGYSAKGETTIEALTQKVRAKAGIDLGTDISHIEQLYTFDSIARDPRGHAVSVCYVACGTSLAPADAASHPEFLPVDTLPHLAYDHDEIISYARERIAGKLLYTNIAFSLLPDTFTLSQLQTAYEAVMGRSLDKRNFRKKILSLGIIHETGDSWREGAHRPAALYAFDSKDLQTIARNFE